MSLEIERAASLVLEAGQSGELRAALQAVADSTTPDGAAHYPTKVCRRLNRLVVCRAYAVPVLQLCHLINLADSCAPRRGAYEHLLLGPERATGSGFRGWIQNAVTNRGWRRPGCELTADGVAVRYDDGVFNVGFAGMPVLAALFEFLCGTIGYAAVDDEFHTMLEPPITDRGIRSAANGIERRLYAYLKEHLPSVQMHGKFQELLDYARSESKTLVVEDATILAFWREKSLNGETGNFRLFRSVFDAYMAFLSALEVATDREAVERARSIGSDRDAGEVDIALLLDDAEAAALWTSPLSTLQEPPFENIRFLNKVDLTALDRLMEHGPRVHRLPWSLLRAEVFGDVQARLSQAARRRDTGDTLSKLIACAGAETYREWHDRLVVLDERVNNALRAALHVALQADDAAERASEDERLEEARDVAKRAFAGISRRGFEDAVVGERGSGVVYEVGAGALAAISDQIHAFLRVLKQSVEEGTDLDDQFAYDHDVFSKQFARIYGVER